MGLIGNIIGSEAGKHIGGYIGSKFGSDYKEKGQNIGRVVGGAIGNFSPYHQGGPMVVRRENIYLLKKEKKNLLFRRNMLVISPKD